MPFEPFQFSTFTRETILSCAPRKSGVYGISDGRRWMYIGETDSIQNALLADFEDGRLTPPDGSAAKFAYEVCDKTDRAARQDWLVLECEPVHNRFGRLGAAGRHGR